jgi:hypothetical protein
MGSDVERIAVARELTWDKAIVVRITHPALMMRSMRNTPNCLSVLYCAGSLWRASRRWR